jgi:hypothetical protein
VPTPTALSLSLLRRSGYRAAVVEKWLPHAKRRSDLWGFGDLLAVSDRREPRFVIVQTTTRDHVAARLAKARQCPELRVWLRAGGAFQVHGWAKRGISWQVKVVDVRAEDLTRVVVQAPRRRRRRSVQQDLFEGM